MTNKDSWGWHKGRSQRTQIIAEIWKKIKGMEISGKLMITNKSCEPMTCWNDTGRLFLTPSQLSIEYPFYIKDRQPESCGLPGLGVCCDGKLNKTLIELNSAGYLSILSINYYGKAIELYDPANCLPRKLLKLDLTKTPFGRYRSKFIWLYNCSAFLSQSYGEKIGCLSGLNYTVLSVLSSLDDPNCKLLKFVSVPTEYSSSTNYLSSIYLTWGQPNDPDSPTIGLGVVVAIGFILLIVCFECCQRRMILSQPAITTPTSTTAVKITSLDRSIIDSYPTVVIGESRRFIKADDATCPICLSDYSPGETLKMLPECLHRFHANCIDEWLHSKATCPLCRISPPHTSP